MGLFNFFKKSKKESSPNEQGDLERNENQTIKKISFISGYKIEFKDSITDNLRSFEAQPCYSSPSEDEKLSGCFLCKNLMASDKLYTRKDIEDLSYKLGYSVFDNIGGKVDSDGSPICACTWKHVTLVRK